LTENIPERVQADRWREGLSAGPVPPFGWRFSKEVFAYRRFIVTKSSFVQRESEQSCKIELRILKQMNEQVHLVLASDSATSAGLAVAVYSAIRQTSRPVAVWVIQEGLDAETIDAMRAFWRGAAEINFLKMTPLPWYWATEKFPLLAWARIEIGDLLPPHVSRCIYMDTDTLVGRDLAELFDMPLQGNSIAMAINNNVPPEVAAYLDSIGIEPERWFNSGVALIDVDAWRRGSIKDGLVRFKRSMPPVLWFPDQDLLNKYFAGRILKLDPCWNRRDVAYSPEGQILHFAGATKPWEMSGDLGQPGLRAWREVYAQWGRTPAPKQRHKIKMLAASVVRHVLTLAHRPASEPGRLRERVGGEVSD
jgi:lipopolysaccharide biosynthesis glycosyltransferase